MCELLGQYLCVTYSLDGKCMVSDTNPGKLTNFQKLFHIDLESSVRTTSRHDTNKHTFKDSGWSGQFIRIEWLGLNVDFHAEVIRGRSNSMPSQPRTGGRGKAEAIALCKAGAHWRRGNLSAVRSTPWETRGKQISYKKMHIRQDFASDISASGQTLLIISKAHE